VRAVNTRGAERRILSDARRSIPNEGLIMTLLASSSVWRRVAKTADPSSAFVNAAKVILLVDVSGKDDFRAKSGLVMTTVALTRRVHGMGS
jgi:hypothetical protein